MHHLPFIVIKIRILIYCCHETFQLMMFKIIRIASFTIFSTVFTIKVSINMKIFVQVSDANPGFPPENLLSW